MLRSAIASLLLLACSSSASDPSCAYIYALPQYMHPGVPQAAADAKCRMDCAQPGYNCQTIATYYPSICACGNTPHTPSPTPKPTPAPHGKCTNPAYHQCGGTDGYTGETCCPYYQGQQQFCHRESDEYWQCCPPGLAGCGGEFWTPYKNPMAIQPSGISKHCLECRAVAKHFNAADPKALCEKIHMCGASEGSASSNQQAVRGFVDCILNCRSVDCLLNCALGEAATAAQEMLPTPLLSVHNSEQQLRGATTVSISTSARDPHHWCPTKTEGTVQCVVDSVAKGDIDCIVQCAAYAPACVTHCLATADPVPCIIRCPIGAA